MTGRVVGHYRILDRLGAGGMGVVYSADDLRLKRRVALKFLPAEACRDAASRERLFAEARAASALEHPNICTVHAIEETPEAEVFIVSTYDSADGGKILGLTAEGRNSAPVQGTAVPARMKESIQIIVNWMEELKAKVKLR